MLLKEHATQEDIVRAYVRAFLVRTLLWQHGYSAPAPALFSRWAQPGMSSGLRRVQRIDILEEAVQIDRAGRAGGVSAEIISDLERKLLHDEEWKISGSLLETRYARICSDSPTN